MYLFFDTETNGLPKNYNGSPMDLDNWPRIIQLAYALYNDAGELIHEHKTLIKPDGWEIPKEDFWIQHGYSTEKSLAEGVPIHDALSAFVAQINRCSRMVAHNLDFDYPVVASEMIRAGVMAVISPRSSASTARGMRRTSTPTRKQRIRPRVIKLLCGVRCVRFGYDKI